MESTQNDGRTIAVLCRLLQGKGNRLLTVLKFCLNVFCHMPYTYNRTAHYMYLIKALKATTGPPPKYTHY